MKNMKNSKYIVICLLVLFFLISGGNSLAADAGVVEPNLGYDFRIISPGETQFVEVETQDFILNGDIHILNRTVIGSGELGIAMERSDTLGELIIMTGIAFSLNGAIVPIFRVGFTPNAISQAMDIGDDTTPNGFVFMLSSVFFSLGRVAEEGGYGIELSLE